MSYHNQPPLPPRTDDRRYSGPYPPASQSVTMPSQQHNRPLPHPPLQHQGSYGSPSASQSYLAFPSASGIPTAQPYGNAPHFPGTTAPYGSTTSYPSPANVPYGKPSSSFSQYPAASPHSSPPVSRPSTTTSAAYPSHDATAAAIAESSVSAELERKLKEEREERRRLEEREFERVKAVSMLEEKLRALQLDMNRTVERAGMASEIESRLLSEQDEKRRLQDRLGTAMEIESRLNHEVEERRRLEQILALEHREKEELREKVASLGTVEDRIRDKEEKMRLEKRLKEVEIEMRVTEKKLEDSDRSKSDMARFIEEKNAELAKLKRQLDSADSSVEIARLERVRSDLERALQAKDAEIAQILERFNRDNHERSATLQQLRALQAKYEPMAPPVADEGVYKRPPPGQPLPIPKGVDLELWHLFTMVDPHQLKIINAVQLRDIINHGPWPPLEYQTVRILFNVYDRTGKNFKFEDFTALWDLVNEWVQVFRANDHHVDEAEFGHIDRQDLRKVLKACGIAASEKFLTSLVTKGYQEERALGWDDFMRCAAKVKLMQDAFRKIDMDKDNWITINYDQFLELVNNSSI